MQFDAEGPLLNGFKVETEVGEKEMRIGARLK